MDIGWSVQGATGVSLVLPEAEKTESLPEEDSFLCLVDATDEGGAQDVLLPVIALVHHSPLLLHQSLLETPSVEVPQDVATKEAATDESIILVEQAEPVDTSENIAHAGAQPPPLATSGGLFVQAVPLLSLQPLAEGATALVSPMPDVRASIPALLPDDVRVQTAPTLQAVLPQPEVAESDELAPDPKAADATPVSVTQTAQTVPKPAESQPMAVGYWRFLLAQSPAEPASDSVLPASPSPQAGAENAPKAMFAIGETTFPAVGMPKAPDDVAVAASKVPQADPTTTTMSAADKIQSTQPPSTVGLHVVVTPEMLAVTESSSPTARAPDILPQILSAVAGLDRLAAPGTPHAMAVFSGAATDEAAQTKPDIVEIRLDPEELGRLRISLEGEGDSMRVRIEAERPETLDLLRRHGERLIETLREAGYDQTEMQFASWSGQAGDSPHRPSVESQPEAAPETAEPLSVIPLLQPLAQFATAGLNLRL